MTDSSLSNPASTADRLSGVTFVDMLGNRLPGRPHITMRCHRTNDRSPGDSPSQILVPCLRNKSGRKQVSKARAQIMPFAFPRVSGASILLIDGTPDFFRPLRCLA